MSGLEMVLEDVIKLINSSSQIHRSIEHFRKCAKT